MRFRVVEDRRAATLLPIIQEWVEHGSVVVGDGWAGYFGMGDAGFDHKVVVHEKEFLWEDGWHTPAIKRKWVEEKAYIKRALVGGPMLQSNLDETGWRHLNKDNTAGLLAALFRNVHTYFSSPMA